MPQQIGAVSIDTDSTDITIPGVYNFINGLQRWRFARARAGKKSDGTGLGGCDVCILGTSVTVGAYASSYLWDTWPALLRNKIQDRHNPAGVQGGMGYTPVHVGDGTWSKTDTPNGQDAKTVWTFSNEASWTLNSGSSTLYGPGMRRAFHATNGANSRARFVWDGTATDAVRKRLQVTDIEILHGTSSGDATITWDRLTSDAFVNVGAGASTGTITGSAATNMGIHSGRQASGLTKTGTNGIQVGAASGTANSRIDGAIAYCDDWDCGFRVHNMGLGGARLDYLGGSMASATAQASIHKWGATAPGGTAAGATQAGLFILDFILNDIGTNTTPTISLKAYTDGWDNVLNAISGLASRPSTLIWIPPCRENQNTYRYYPSYVAALYTLANKYNCAIFDSQAMLGNGTHENTVVPNGWSASDGTHWSDLGNEYWADIFYQILMGV